jgi:hypothetical protein
MPDDVVLAQPGRDLGLGLSGRAGFDACASAPLTDHQNVDESDGKDEDGV